MSFPKSIALIGAGKLATHLGLYLQKTGFSVQVVWSRTEQSAQKLGDRLACHWVNQFKDIPEVALYIILVKDDAITSVAKQLAVHINSQALVVHTSGAMPSTVLQDSFKRYGVFYPLQSFSEKTSPDFRSIPFCINANYEEDRTQLKQLAEQLSEAVYLITDKQKTQLHLAAVFTNNFTNYLQFISNKLLVEQQLPHSILQPLLNETVRKLSDISPLEAQTGPAIRGDNNTIEKHLELLNNHPEWSALYELLSSGIGRDMSK